MVVLLPHHLSIRYFKMTKERKETLISIAVITTGFLLLFLLSHMWWCALVSVAVAVLGLIWPDAASLIVKLWMKLAWLLNLIIPKIILSLVFFLLLFPLSLLNKLFSRKDNLMLKNTTNSTFIESNKVFTRESFETPW